MTKNITRKGFALGAGLSLAVTGLVAPAAYAVDAVQLTETVGTGYNVLNTGNFEVSALITNAAKSGGSETVKFRIVDADSGLTAAGIDVGNGTAATPDGALTSTTAGATIDDVLATGWTAAGVAVVNSGGIAAGTAYELMLEPTATTDGFSVTVQAWVDFDGDNAIDAGEYASPVRTVNFYAADEVTYTLNLVTPTLGAASINSTVTTSPALNVAASAALSVGYATYVASSGAYTALSAATTVSSPAGVFSAGVARDATDGDHELAIAGGGLAAGTYVAQAIAGVAEVGSAVFYTVGASDATQISAVSVSASSDVSGTNIRTNSAASFEVTVKDATNVPVAGETVVFSFTETHADTDAVISVGGHSIKNGDTVKTVSATTDADGVATVSATFSGFAAGNNFMTVSAKVAAVTATGDLAPDFVDTAFATLYAHNTLGTGSVLKVAAGSSYTLTYSAVDNFGALLTDSNYRVELVSGAVSKSALLTSGIASFSVVDDTTVTESWVASVSEYSGINWAASTGALTALAPIIGASNSAAAVTLTGTATAALNLGDLTSSDTRLGQTATPTAGGTTLGGIVTDAAGAATYSSVTLSAPGVMFANGAVTSVGSITVQTSAAGAFAGVAAYSNTSGEVTITATAGAASKTLKVTFAAAADNTGAVLTISAPDNILPGSTFNASALLVDKYGNPVDSDQPNQGTLQAFSFSAVSPGFQVGTNPAATDADGMAKLAYFLGNNDSGTITLTAVYDIDGDATTVDDRLVTTKTVTIGTADVATWTRKLDDSSAKIYAKNIVGAGKVQFMLNGKEIAWVNASSAADSKLRTANGSSYLVRTVEFAAGKNVLEVYVDGVRTTRTAYTK